jgi:hypothetical protein
MTTARGQSVRVLSPTACLGLMPLNEESFLRGMEMRPDVVGVDAGSLDPGPHYLGAGTPHVARFQATRELEILLRATLKAEIPLVIGTAGGSGGLRHIDWNLECIAEAARRLGRKVRVAVIPTTLDPEWIKGRLTTVTAPGCQHDSLLTLEDVDACTEVVAQVGVEVIMKGFATGADVILVGRACDNAVFASLPILLGFPKGHALYMGKILECGGLCLDPSAGYETVVAELDHTGFTLYPANPDFSCTLASVAAHALYERTDAARQSEPGGTLDTSGVTFQPREDGTIRIEGSRFEEGDPYLIKLEGAQKVGYRSIFMSGARDEVMIANMREIRRNALERIDEDMKGFGLIAGEDFHASIRLYGLDGVLGDLEPVTTLPHEIGVVLEVVALSQETARNIAYYGKNFITWVNFPGRITTAGNVAYAHSPSIIDVGEVYRLRVHHLLPFENMDVFVPYEVEVG